MGSGEERCTRCGLPVADECVCARSEAAPAGGGVVLPTERCARCKRVVFDRGAAIREAVRGPGKLNADQADAAIMAACECRKVCANCHGAVFLPSVTMRDNDALRAWAERVGRCVCAPAAKAPRCATCAMPMAKCECEAEAKPAGGTAPASEEAPLPGYDRSAPRMAYSGLTETVLYLRTVVVRAGGKRSVGDDTGVAAAAALVSAVRELRLARREAERDARSEWYRRSGLVDPEDSQHAEWYRRSGFGSGPPR